MSFLLDTNVVSEWVKPWPDPSVITWLADVDEDRVFLSVGSFAEIRLASNCLPTDGVAINSRPGSRRNCRNDSRDAFSQFDQLIAETWGLVIARGRKAGHTLATMDGLFAATAKVHDLTLVTRYIADFAGLGIRLLNAWQPNLT